MAQREYVSFMAESFNIFFGASPFLWSDLRPFCWAKNCAVEDSKVHQSPSPTPPERFTCRHCFGLRNLTTGPRVENNTLSQNRSLHESKLKELRPFSYRT